MAFRENLRLEAIYFKNLRALIEVLKGLKAGEPAGKISDILDNCIQENAAILLLYRNLGEMYNDLISQLMEQRKDLEALKTLTEKYHDELNEKIDEVNNYLMALIRDLEAELASMTKTYIIDATEGEPERCVLTYKGDPVTFNMVNGWLASGNNVLVRSVIFGKPYYHVLVNADQTKIEWGAVEVNGINSISEEGIQLLSDDTATFSFDYIDVAAMESRLTQAIKDIEIINTHTSIYYNDDVTFNTDYVTGTPETKSLQIQHNQFCQRVTLLLRFRPSTAYQSGNNHFLGWISGAGAAAIRGPRNINRTIGGVDTSGHTWTLLYNTEERRYALYGGGNFTIPTTANYYVNIDTILLS